MFLGIDVQDDVSYYHLSAPGMKDGKGKLTFEGFPTLLAQAQPTAMACEYTGRLAEPFADYALSQGIPVYFIDTVSRAQYQRLFGATSKTDPLDAQLISRVLARWSVPDGLEFQMNKHLFVDAGNVRFAWRLRSMLFEAEKMKEVRLGAENKARIASRTMLPDIARRWKTIADIYPVEEVEAEVDAFTSQHFAGENRLLQTIPGIGPITARWLIAVLHPINRFETLWEAKKYVGLNPHQSESGKKAKKPRTSKTGNSKLRANLFMTALRFAKEKADNRFADVYKRHAAKGTPEKKCVQIVAVDLFCVAFHILRKMEPYRDPARPAVAVPVLPEYLASPSDYARMKGITKQAVSQRIKRGRLPVEEWQGRTYIVREQTGGQP